MLKSELRKLFMEKRDQLSAADWQLRNEALHHNVVQFFKDLPSNQTVASFLPIAHKKEIDTKHLHETLSSFPFLNQIVYPRVVSTRSMEFYRMESELEVEISAWGIPEPKENPVNCVVPEEIDVMLVPLLAFDAKGHRVGYGKGFYDQYLLRCSPKMIKIGLSLFAEPVVIDDIEKTDIALDSIIFP